MSADQSNHCEVIISDLPSEYEFLEVLEEGRFGQVLKCRKRDTEQIVTVKFPKDEPESTIEEVVNFVDFDVRRNVHRYCIVKGAVNA